MPRIGNILGSTRPNRNGEQVANWGLDIARQRGDAEYELLDLRTFDLPNYDEPFPAAMQNYQNEHTKRWPGHEDAPWLRGQRGGPHDDHRPAHWTARRETRRK